MEVENQEVLLPFLKRVRDKYPNKSIWVYSGFTFEELLGKIPSRAATKTAKEILKLCDVLVDGRYIDSQRDITLKWRGSKNQRVLDIQQSLKRNEVILYCE